MLPHVIRPGLEFGRAFSFGHGHELAMVESFAAAPAAKILSVEQGSEAGRWRTVGEGESTERCQCQGGDEKSECHGRWSEPLMAGSIDLRPRRPRHCSQAEG